MANWTTEQQQVISDRGSNLLVAAGAGSGKTAVLVERIIGLVTDEAHPEDIDRILVVTFTQAAAAEMRERIRAALIRMAGEGNRLATRQLELLPRAAISTMHAFCMNLLRSHFHLIGLDPGFRIGDAAECGLMLHEALEDVLVGKYAQATMPESLADMLEAWSGYRGDTPLRELILSLYHYSRSAPWPEAWMAESVARFSLPAGTDFGSTIWGALLMDQAGLMLSDATASFEEAHRLADACDFAVYLAALEADLTLSERLAQSLSEGWDVACRLFSSMSFPAFKPLRGEVDASARDEVKALRKKGRDRLEKIRDELLAFTSEEAATDINTMQPRLHALMELVNEMSRSYMRLKRRKGIVDFNDLEHMTISLLLERTDEDGELRPSETAQAMKRQFVHVLVDEYQDSNMVQELILRAVATEGASGGNLFMVGDVKQSIYRFRQALPELFMEKYATWPDADGEGRKRILLYKNFRSRPGVLHAVNLVFRRIMTQASGEMDYTERESLIPGLPWDAAVPGMPSGGWPVEIHVIGAAGEPAGADEPGGPGMPVRPGESDRVRESGRPGESDSPEGSSTKPEEEATPEELEAAHQEAVWAAVTLRRLVEGADGVPPMAVEDRKGGVRPLRWSDAVILLRSTAGRAAVFVEELALFGIPAYADAGSGYFSSIEISLVMCWLRILDNPLQDIPLASVLRSFLHGFTEAELLCVKDIAPDRTLFDAVSACAGHAAAGSPECPDGLTLKCSTFLDDHRRWRELSGHLPVWELLWRFYHETGFLGRFGNMPNGTIRTANLRLLLDRAARFEQTGLQGLFQFIRFIDRMVERRGDADSARVLGEADDVVRIMSIHKSKGLEFPVVLLCGTGTRFNRRDLNAPMLMHQRLGWGPDVVRVQEGVRYPSAAKLALRHAAYREMIAEEMRILYVAMTRARERLIVCGRGDASLLNTQEALTEVNSPCSADLTPIPAADVLNMKSHLELILASVSYGRETHGLFSIHAVDSTGLARLHAERMETPAEMCPEAMPVSMGFAEMEAVRRAFEWTSPFAMLSGIPAKATVTGIKRGWDLALSDDEAADLGPETQDAEHPLDIPMPAFLSGDGTEALSGTAYGSLMHMAVQHLEPVVDRTEADLVRRLDFLVQEGHVSPEDRRRFGMRGLKAWMASPLYERMGRSSSIQREDSFTVRIPVREAFPGSSHVDSTETIVLQGVIDCWFEEPDGLVVVDFKTDRSLERLDAYRQQLSWYARALQLAVGTPVKETWIWSFHENEALRVSLFENGVEKS